MYCNRLDKGDIEQSLTGAPLTQRESFCSFPFTIYGAPKRVPFGASKSTFWGQRRGPRIQLRRLRCDVVVSRQVFDLVYFKGDLEESIIVGNRRELRFRRSRRDIAIDIFKRLGS